ncbi:hypothetical protein C8F04DRAFT_1184008 [Mycena alexandri]|uniref:Uncharacterized protein n=1 Tax=Mycena alexandri TaxID=1745969 RepID=A0AAD6X645_9AGAR|nr:hypothetical protein C8F04DRAFT_1184008 [Mycena alexandri]
MYTSFSFWSRVSLISSQDWTQVLSEMRISTFFLLGGCAGRVAGLDGLDRQHMLRVVEPLKPDLDSQDPRPHHFQETLERMQPSSHSRDMLAVAQQVGPAERLALTSRQQLWPKQESDSDGTDKKKHKRRTQTVKGKDKATQSDLKDPSFSTDNGEDSEANAKITNEETVPEGSHRSKAPSAPKRKRGKLAATASTSTVSSETAQQDSSTTGSRKRNPLWFFFTVVTDTDHSEKGEPTDRFFRCIHGESMKVLRMTKLMCGSLNGNKSSQFGIFGS